MGDGKSAPTEIERVASALDARMRAALVTADTRWGLLTIRATGHVKHRLCRRGLMCARYNVVTKLGLAVRGYLMGVNIYE